MDELPQESRELLDAARSALSPTRADRARIWAAIELELAGGGGPDGDGGPSGPSTNPAPTSVPPTGGAAPAAANPGALGSSWLPKGLAVLGLLGLVGGGAIGLSLVDPPEARSARGIHLVVGAPEVVPGEEPTIEAPPVAGGAAPAPVRRASSHASRGSGTTSTTDDLGREVALLHGAQAAWRGGRSAEALRLLDEHRAAYPRSALGYERDALRVLTLCSLGRDDQARRVGARLLERSGSSPWRRAVEQSCAGR